MRAVDTNIVVRAIIADIPEQREIADRIIASGVFIPTTVLLEIGWVLGKVYRQSRAQLADSLTALLDLPTVRVGDEPGLRRAIELFRDGADLADAIHLVAAGGSEAFVTFDRGLARLPGTPLPVILAEA